MTVPSRSSSKVAALRAALPSAAALGLAVTALPADAFAQNLKCGGVNLSRNTSDGVVIDFNPLLSNTGSYNRNQAHNGVVSSFQRITDDSVFDFTATNDLNAATDGWSASAFASTGLAGVTAINGGALSGFVDCSLVSNGQINTAQYVYNTAHPWNSANDYACTAIHEFMHGLGFAHNSSNGSVLQTTSSFGHNQRCHVASPRVDLSATDIVNIAAYYK